MLRVCLTVVALLFSLPIFAADKPIVRLSVYPQAIQLQGLNATAQLVVTGHNPDGREVDLTALATYSVGNPTTIRVEASGRVVPLANGNTNLTISANGFDIQVPVSTRHMDTPLPINFGNHIVPIFTKLGCSSGGCHGKIAGQNGFRLSLLGFDPQFDYDNLIKEARGRRLLPAAPDASLLLTKATGQVAHGGGKKLEPASEEYHLIRQWIASGMPFGKPEDPTVQRITIFPERRVVAQQHRQQLAVYAHYSDGTVEDVTRRAQYESNDTDIAVVNDMGVVTTMTMTGQAAVMARFQGHVAVFQAIVPRSGTPVTFDFPERNLVDRATARKWRDLNIAPSELCSDEVFIRRAYLDITGTIPDAAEVLAFVTDTNPAKREKLVDRLLETPEYAYFFANKWADVLRVKRRNQQARAFGTFAFHAWLQNAIATDKPYDQLVREIICAVGDESKCPPTVWYKEVRTPENFVDDVSQVFLGQRLACANCHHHPYEKWSQDDYWGLAAFYSRVGIRNQSYPGQPNQQSQKQVVFLRPSGTVQNKRTGQPAPLKPLDAEPVQSHSEVDPRTQFVNWLTQPSNPYFARAVVNRYWAHFFGRGIVDPLDDMRVTNPPSNPELLDALAEEFLAHRFSLKALVRTICTSRTYQLSSVPNESNQGDKQSFARYYPKRLQAEVLFDAVAKLTGSPSSFPGLPTDRYAPNRAIMLPDEAFASYFLDVAGRPQRISACECERVNEASLAMTLHLLNSQEIQDKIARNGGRADSLANDPRPDREKVTELFLLATGTRPSQAKLEQALEHIEKHRATGKTRVAYENIIWALLNSKAFLFNQ
jgi:hypothetical protein